MYTSMLSKSVYPIARPCVLSLLSLFLLFLFFLVLFVFLVLLCFGLLCYVLFCSVLFCSVLFCSVLLCSVLLCSVLFCLYVRCLFVCCLFVCWFVCWLFVGLLVCWLGCLGCLLFGLFGLQFLFLFLSSSLTRDAVRARGVDTDTTCSPKLALAEKRVEWLGFRHTAAPLRGFSFFCTTGATLPYASFAAVAFDGGCLPAHGLGFFLHEPVFPFLEASFGARSLRTSFQLLSLGSVRRRAPLTLCLTESSRASHRVSSTSGCSIVAVSSCCVLASSSLSTRSAHASAMMRMALVLGEPPP